VLSGPFAGGDGDSDWFGHDRHLLSGEIAFG
jgi:hypothetical protein